MKRFISQKMISVRVFAFRLVVKILLWIVEKIVAKTKTKTDDRILEYLRDPINKIIKRGSL